MSEPQTATTKAPLEGVLEQQQNCLTRLGEALEGLKHRLAPVLLEAPAPIPEKGQDKASECAIVQTLQRHNEQLEDMVGLVGKVVGGLQI